jgi:glycosyltransferase involved in cell wall biosynthesis
MKKRLLFITPLFPKNSAEDTVVPFVSQFTKHFAQNTDVVIDVISLMYPFSSKQYRYENITVYPIGSNFKRSFRLFPYMLMAIVKGISLCKKNNYDGILCFWYRESTLIGRVLSKIFKIKQIVWMLGQDIKKDNKYIRLLKISPQQLVMMSLQQNHFFYTNYKIRINKIANVAITRDLFPELNTNERTINILGVGNLGALKNYALFIEIVAEVQTKNLNAVIIGEGEETDLLKAKVNQLGLTNTIRFTGALSHKEVLEYMNNSKIFLHTSKSEGGGTVLQEALYSGCQVVSTIDIEGSNENENFFYSLDKAKLSHQIKTILNQTQQTKRIEKFKMEDTIKTIYDCFYS